MMHDQLEDVKSQLSNKRNNNRIVSINRFRIGVRQADAGPFFVRSFIMLEGKQVKCKADVSKYSDKYRQKEAIIVASCMMEFEDYSELIALKLKDPSRKKPLQEYLASCLRGSMNEERTLEITKGMPDDIKADIRFRAWVAKTKADEDYSLFCYTTNFSDIQRVADNIDEHLYTDVPADIREQVFNRLDEDSDLGRIRRYASHIYYLKDKIGDISRIVHGPQSPDELEMQEEYKEIARNADRHLDEQDEQFEQDF
jgi:hypothetical protein